MSVVISDEVLRAIAMSEAELKQELALLFFQKEKFTLAQAARFADLNRLQFQQLLAARQIPLHYYLEDLEQDFKTLQRLGF